MHVSLNAVSESLNTLEGNDIISRYPVVDDRSNASWNIIHYIIWKNTKSSDASLALLNIARENI